jgi:ubiquitin
MNKLFITIILIAFGTLSIFSQYEQYSAPINWELYRVSDKKVSLLLPKLPVLISESNICTQTQTYKYAVYADDVVYGLNINLKINAKVPDFCSPKKEFDKNSFRFRVNEVKNQLKSTESKIVKINNLEAEFIKGELLNYWLVNDLKNNQWFELWTANADENKKEVKDFISSVKISENPKGIEIKDGSESTLGDFKSVSIDKKLSENNTKIEDLNSELDRIKDKDFETKEIEPSGETSKVTFIVKPYPKYTEQARRNNTQGSCKLRVSFYANGAIGSISPFTTLPDGLTEQAIAAAKKIIFLPAKRNGKKYNVTKTVEYTFTIF